MSDGTEIFRIITANRLKDGVIVYLKMTESGASWVEAIADASSLDEESIEKGKAIAEKDEAECHVISAYDMEVTGRNRPMSAREKVRAQGPSVKYGKDSLEADFSI